MPPLLHQFHDLEQFQKKHGIFKLTKVRLELGVGLHFGVAGKIDIMPPHGQVHMHVKERSNIK
jgi:hypothetical protein